MSCYKHFYITRNSFKIVRNPLQILNRTHISQVPLLDDFRKRACSDAYVVVLLRLSQQPHASHKATEREQLLKWPIPPSSFTRVWSHPSCNGAHHRLVDHVVSDAAKGALKRVEKSVAIIFAKTLVLALEGGIAILGDDMLQNTVLGSSERHFSE